MHFFHERAEEAEIVVRGGAEGGAVRGGMHVRNVRADSEMDGDRNFVLIGGEENAGGGMLRIEFARGEKFSGGFAVADASVRRGGGDFVEISAGFTGHAEGASTEAGFDVFGSVAAKSDFEIMDEGGAVHGDAGNEAAADEIDQDGAEAGFDDVATDAPENGFAGAFCGMDGGEQGAEIVCGEEIGERVEKIFEGGVGGEWFGEVGYGDFTFAGGQRIRFDLAELEREDGVDGHGWRNNFSVGEKINPRREETASVPRLRSG